MQLLRLVIYTYRIKFIASSIDFQSLFRLNFPITSICMNAEKLIIKNYTHTHSHCALVNEIAKKACIHPRNIMIKALEPKPPMLVKLHLRGNLYFNINRRCSLTARLHRRRIHSLSSIRIVLIFYDFYMAKKDFFFSRSFTQACLSFPPYKTENA